MYRRRRQKPLQDIPTKANRILNLILLAFLLIVLRIWHLSVIQHEERQENALKPQRRTLIEAAKRGTIRDRYNIPLAINKMQYNASLLYSPLRQLPAARWESLNDGTKVKRFPRKEYITKLATLLADKLALDALRIEDLIHAKGALYNQIPLVIKEDISEQEYYSLRSLEKDWPGICMQKLPRRDYPLGKVGADIIGYLGAINHSEYEKIIEEISALQGYLTAIEIDEELPLPEGFSNDQQVRTRLKELKAKRYTLSDRVGKAGIEGRFERDLRGLSGKKNYRSDARGNLLQELPGTHRPLSGKRLLLTISAELQEYAEELLIQNESIRDTRVTCLDDSRKRSMATKKPWIKGGAIVVLEPNTGEILALASHPRYDPNDFILTGNLDANRKKLSHLKCWLESESHLADIWDQKCSLKREIYDRHKQSIVEEQKILTWENYLQIILASDSPLLPLLSNIEISQAIELISTSYPPLETFCREDQDLCIDLCRLVIDENRFDEHLCGGPVGLQKIASYRNYSSDFGKLEMAVCAMAKGLFHDLNFTLWRQQNEKMFLTQKRAEEKAQKRYAKPYIDLLDAQEQLLFKAFWDENKWDFLEIFLCAKLSSDEKEELKPYLQHFTSWHHEINSGAHNEMEWHASYLSLKDFLLKIPSSQRIPYLKTFRSFYDLTRPLVGKYPQLKNYRTIQTEKELALAFYPRYGMGYGRSQAYRQSSSQGSIFKIVTAYEALMQRFQNLGENISRTQFHLDPLEMTDANFSIGKESYVGYTEDGKPIPRFYKGGRIPRSVGARLGRMGILKAIETSSNPYFALLAGDILNSPNDLAAAARLFNYGERTGIDLPGEIPGKVPTDLEINRTGLYAMAIGQHSLVVTPLQASIMLATIANGGKVLKPKLIKTIMSWAPLPESRESLISAPLSMYRTPTIQKNIIPMPTEVRDILLDGMHRVVQRSQAESLTALSRLYRPYPEAISDYIDLKDQLLGKTSTAESIERIDLDLKKGINMYNHVWFGGIAYHQNDEALFVAKDKFGFPEVVVIVYLKYGGFGKEGAPIAAQMVTKWREIKNHMAK